MKKSLAYLLFLSEWEYTPESDFAIKAEDVIMEAVEDKPVPSIKNNEFISKKRDKSLPRWKR